MTGPLVTIAIPTLRRLAYLAEAVESALGQTWPHLEVLVGDDGTTTEIPEWCHTRAARDPRLRYHRNARNLGYAGNLNAIAGRGTGEFIVLMGDDDRLLPRFVATLVAAATPATAVVFCNHHVIDADGRRLDEETARVTRQYHRAELAPGTVENPSVRAWQMAIFPSAAMVRRDDLMRLRLHEDLSSPDIEFFIRLATEGKRFEFVPEYLAEYRVHLQSVTAGGLWNDRLVSRLLPIQTTADVEPFKRELLEHLLINAVSRCLQQGDWRTARQFLGNDYYPRASRRLMYLTQQACATLPPPVGAKLYRAMASFKHAAGY
jgi:glycosyltransferase involved in cell wall biosynthesis